MTLLQEETVPSTIRSIPTVLNLTSTARNRNGATTFDANCHRNLAYPVMPHPQVVTPSALPPFSPQTVKVVATNALNPLTQKFIYIAMQAKNLRREEVLKLFHTVPVNEALWESYIDGLCPVGTNELTDVFANTFGVSPGCGQGPRPSSEVSLSNDCRPSPWAASVPSPIPQEIQALIDAYIFGKPLTVIVSHERLYEHWSLNLPKNYGYVVMGFFRIIGVEVCQKMRHLVLSIDDF